MEFLVTLVNGEAEHGQLMFQRAPFQKHFRGPRYAPT